MKRNTDPNYWPDHLRPLFVAIGAVMNGRRLHPEVLERVSIDTCDVLSGHKITVRHLAGEAAATSGNHYRIEIAGPRIAGKWAFRSGELERLSQAAHAATLVA